MQCGNINSCVYLLIIIVIEVFGVADGGCCSSGGQKASCQWAPPGQQFPGGGEPHYGGKGNGPGLCV